MSNHQNTITGYVYPNVVTINGSISSDFGASNLAVLQQVDPNINWTQFDKWDMSSSYHQYFNQTDGHVDAVYIIWRNISTPWDGFGDLSLPGSTHTYTTNDGKKISHSAPTIGMTVNAGRKQNPNGTNIYSYTDRTLWILVHEYGHYLFGSAHDFDGNACGPNARRGLGLMACAYYGPLAMNPYEKYLLGYTIYADIFYDLQGTLGDYLQTGSSYRIPIPLFINGNANTNPYEYYIIANHQSNSLGSRYKSSYTNADGIYIYHVLYPEYGPNTISMVDADGLYQWAVSGWQTAVGLGGPRDWRCVNLFSGDPSYLPKIKKVTVDKLNGRYVLQPVISVPYQGSGPSIWWDRWYDQYGVQQYAFGGPQDSYNIGYNQIFSPWSNPPSVDHSNNPTNITTELLSKNGTTYTYNIKFYTSYNSSLSAPPSKPQNLVITKDNSTGTAKLTWYPYEEPTMNGGHYKIFRSENLTNQTLIATINSTTGGSTPVTTWIDQDFTVGNGNYKLYYSISAVDNTGKESVHSDPNWIAYNRQALKPNIGKNAITDYELLSIYPNPFNPSTIIRYSLKDPGLVKLEIYDILGKKVRDLVNEVEQSGSYEIEFNSENLSSGIYLCKISVNNLTAIQKMILLK